MISYGIKEEMSLIFSMDSVKVEELIFNKYESIEKKIQKLTEEAEECREAALEEMLLGFVTLKSLTPGSPISTSGWGTITASGGIISGTINTEVLKPTESNFGFIEIPPDDYSKMGFLSKYRAIHYDIQTMMSALSRLNQFRNLVMDAEIINVTQHDLEYLQEV